MPDFTYQDMVDDGLFDRRHDNGCWPEPDIQYQHPYKSKRQCTILHDIDWDRFHTDWRYKRRMRNLDSPRIKWCWLKPTPHDFSIAVIPSYNIGRFYDCPRQKDIKRLPWTPGEPDTPTSLDPDKWDLGEDANGGPDDDQEDDQKDDQDEHVTPELLSADAETRDPDHDDQCTLVDFEDPDDKDQISAEDDRLDGLPYLADIPPAQKLHPNSPARNGPRECDQCSEEDPWQGPPVERGVEDIRPGTPFDGDPSLPDHDLDRVSTRECDCCRCPLCDSSSIRHRQTKTPDFACNNCGLEFNNPVDYPWFEDSPDVERECLFWECRHCGDLTQAPFRGIPAGLLDD